MSQVLISLSCKPDEKKAVGGQKPGARARGAWKIISVTISDMLCVFNEKMIASFFDGTLFLCSIHSWVGYRLTLNIVHIQIRKWNKKWILPHISKK